MKAIIPNLKKIIVLLPFCFFISINGQTVSSFVGGVQGYADGTGAEAKFRNPWGIAVDSAGILYVADAANNRIRKITPDGIVTTLAGSTLGYADGTGAAAQFSYPAGLAVDAAGNVFVADTQNNRIRKITNDGVVSTFAGGNWGFADGIGSAAQFNYPYGIAFDASGNLYVADKENNRIRKITPEAVVSTFAGSTQGFADGTGNSAQFYYPYGLAIDAIGNVYVGEVHRIRKITPDGVVTSFAGASNAEFGTTDGIGSEARFNTPSGLVVTSTGTIFVTDRGNHRIRKVTPDGLVTTFAGSSYGFSNGVGSAARFYYPNDLVISNDGSIYCTDAANNRIRKITMSLDIADYELKNQIILYPNPAGEFINIESSYFTDAAVTIFDIHGRQLQSETIYEGKTTIKIGYLCSGIYIMQLVTVKGTLFTKFLKN